MFHQETVMIKNYPELLTHMRGMFFMFGKWSMKRIFRPGEWPHTWDVNAESSSTCNPQLVSNKAYFFGYRTTPLTSFASGLHPVFSLFSLSQIPSPKRYSPKDHRFGMFHHKRLELVPPVAHTPLESPPHQTSVITMTEEEEQHTSIILVLSKSLLEAK